MSPTTNNCPAQRSAALAVITQQLGELSVLSSRALAAKYLEVMGEPTRSNNRSWMLRTIAWRLQEQAEGGLSQRAEDKIDELGDALPLAWRMRQAPLAPELAATVSVPGVAVAPSSAASPPLSPRRDPRLPPAGTVLRRTHGDREHVVSVGEQTFEYQGRVYRSLSQVAVAITGKTWNGFAFFRAELAACKTAETSGLEVAA